MPSLNDAIRVATSNPDVVFGTFTVDTLSPFKVFLDGSTTSVPATAMPFASYASGIRGIALIRQGQLPLCIPTDSAAGDYSSQQFTSAPTNVTSTTPVAIAGLSLQVEAPGPSAVYMVELDAQVLFSSTATNICRVKIDASTVAIDLRTAGNSGDCHSAHKKWRITGLTAGSHTFTFTSQNTAAATSVEIGETATLATVTRVS